MAPGATLAFWTGMRLMAADRADWAWLLAHGYDAWGIAVLTVMFAPPFGLAFGIAYCAAWELLRWAITVAARRRPDRAD